MLMPVLAKFIVNVHPPDVVDRDVLCSAWRNIGLARHFLVQSDAAQGAVQPASRIRAARWLMTMQAAAHSGERGRRETP